MTRTERAAHEKIVREILEARAKDDRQRYDRMSKKYPIKSVVITCNGWMWGK